MLMIVLLLFLLLLFLWKRPFFFLNSFHLTSFIIPIPKKINHYIMSLLSPSTQANGQANARLRNKATSSHPRQSSGVYNTFSSKQIAGLREAFNTIDANSDGFITRTDVEAILTNLGQPCDPANVNKLMQNALSEGQGERERINFTQFLTMFGEHLSEMDEAADLVSAFECFDEKDEGKIDAGELRYWLGEVGDRMKEEEIDRLLAGPFMDRGGRKFDYKSFVEAVKMSEPVELE